jgi:hypothetical protein
MITARYTYNDERATVADFPYLTPTNGLITILSSPYSVHKTYLNTVFSAFQLNVWILLIISYFSIIALSFLRSMSIRMKINTLIDYFVILIGQG